MTRSLPIISFSTIFLSILKKTGLHFSLFLVIVACQSSRHSSNDATGNTKDRDQLLEEHFEGEAYQVKWNKSRTHFLAIKNLPKETKIRTPQSLHFVIMEAAKNQIVYENRVLDGKVSWYDDTKIEMSGYQEHMDHPNDKGRFLYDLKQKRIIQYPKEKIWPLEKLTWLRLLS